MSIELSRLPDKYQEQVMEKLGIKKKKKSKYSNKKTWVDGICFDSVKEARAYSVLEVRLKAGDIKGYCRQARFVTGRGEGEKRRAIEYVVDFIIFNNDGTYNVVDVKGYETEVFKLKKKLFEGRYDLVLDVEK